MQIEHRRLELLDDFITHIEEADSAWATQELSARGRKKVTLKHLDIEWNLPRRLTSIEQKVRAILTSKPSNLGGRLEQSSIGRHVRQRHELDAGIEHRPERLDRDLPVLVVRHHVNRHPALGNLQE